MLINIVKMSYVFVFIGGGLGCLLRYFLSSVARWPVSLGCFPVKTFVVNMVGCLLIGVFSGLFLRLGCRNEAKDFLVAGFCGGFTTFSTFSREAVDLFLAGNGVSAIAYAVLSLVAGMALVALGYAIAYKVAC